MNRILVSGASGDLGQALIKLLLSQGHRLNLVSRRPIQTILTGDIRVFQVDVGANTDWRPALQGCSKVIHLAGQIPGSNIPEIIFSQVNDIGTARLVKCVIESSVEQLIFASSVSAVGGNMYSETVDESIVPRPSSAYGASKLAAERHLALIASSGRSAIALRFPSIYGSLPQGHWKSIFRLAASGIPLPFASINNRRSVIARSNAASCLLRLACSPVDNERSGIYFVADGVSVSLKDIFTWLRQGMGRSPMLFPVPAKFLGAFLAGLGQGYLSGSLFGNLEIDCGKFERTFGWKAPLTPREAFMLSGGEYLQKRPLASDVSPPNF